MLKVKVKGATNLPDVDTFSGKSDPYATVSFQGKFLVGVTNASFVVGCLQCLKYPLIVSLWTFNVNRLGAPSLNHLIYC